MAERVGLAFEGAGRQYSVMGDAAQGEDDLQIFHVGNENRVGGVCAIIAMGKGSRRLRT